MTMLPMLVLLATWWRPWSGPWPAPAPPVPVVLTVVSCAAPISTRLPVFLAKPGWPLKCEPDTAHVRSSIHLEIGRYDPIPLARDASGRCVWDAAIWLKYREPIYVGRTPDAFAGDSVDAFVPCGHWYVARPATVAGPAACWSRAVWR